MRQRAMAARALAVFCAVLLGPGAAAVAKDSPRREVRDLHYGDVLFQFFQDDYFDAVVRLEAARDFGRLPNHAVEAELLAAGMYLSLGLYSEADRIFNELHDSIEQPGRSRAQSGRRSANRSAPG